MPLGDADAKKLAAAVANWDGDTASTVFSDQPHHQAFLRTLATGSQQDIMSALMDDPPQLSQPGAAQVGPICGLINNMLGADAFEKSNANIVSGIVANMSSKSNPADTNWY